MLFRRPDGVLLKDAPPLRRLMPHLMAGRNEAAVYFEHELRVDKALAWLEKKNEGLTEKRFGFFHLVLCGIVRTLALRPHMNRYVVGRRLYQRTNIALSFAVKKKFSDEGALTTVKIVFQPDDTLADVAKRVDDAIHFGRSDKESQADKETAIVTRLPRFLLRFLLWAQRGLDYFNLLPDAMIEPDPLYASIFLANLGSIGLDAPFHHLYEYGTVPIFAVLGRIQPALVVGEDGKPATAQVARMRYTFDERIADGYYGAKSLELFKGFIEDPGQLEQKPVLTKAA